MRLLTWSRGLLHHGAGRVVTAFLAVAVVAFGLAPPGVAQSSPPTALPAGDVVGVVLLPDGSPAVGSIVLVTAVLDTAATEPEPAQVLARGIAGPGGAFGFPLSVTPDALASAERNGGFLNYRVTTLFPSDTASYATQHASFIQLGSLGSVPAAPLSLQYGAEDQTDSIPTSATVDECGMTTTTVDQATVMTKVGEYHSWNDMSGWFKYGKTADSEIEVAMAPGGGGYKIGGVSKISNSVANEVTWNGSSRFGRQLRTEFEYRKDRDLAQCQGRIFYDAYAIRAVRWSPPGNDLWTDVSQFDGPERQAAAENRGFSDPMAPDTDWTKSVSKNYLYEAAATAFGVGLKATSGYSNNVKMYWKAGTEFKEYYLFGRNNQPDLADIVYASAGDPPSISPAAQTTTSSGTASWTVNAPQNKNRPTTLSMAYGDGASETRSIPQGTSISTFKFDDHTFNATRTYIQRATVVETGASSTSTTYHGQGLGINSVGQLTVTTERDGISGRGGPYERVQTWGLGNGTDQCWMKGALKTHVGSPHATSTIEIDYRAIPATGAPAACKTAALRAPKSGAYTISYLNTGLGDYVGGNSGNWAVDGGEVLRVYNSSCMAVGGHRSMWQQSVAGSDFSVSGGVGTWSGQIRPKPSTISGGAEIANLPGTESAICVHQAAGTYTGVPDGAQAPMIVL